MDKRIMAVCDLDEGYAYRMMEVLKIKKDVPFEVYVFTNIDSLLLFGQKEKIECLLIGESAFCAEIRELSAVHIFILNESGTALWGDDFYNINKFQSTDYIVKEVMSYYAEKSSGTNLKQFKSSASNLKIIGIYTPVGRCLQTTFTMTLGQILARSHKILYLNFECYSGLSRMLGKEFKSDLADLMYFFECVREKLVYRLDHIVEQVNGMDFIPPAAVYPDLMNIPGKQWIELFKELKDIGGYEYILLDLTDYVNGLWEILRECDIVYTITKNDFMAAAKMDEYEKILKTMAFEDVAVKTKRLNFPIFKQLPVKFDELTYGELANYIKINILGDIYGL